MGGLTSTRRLAALAAAVVLLASGCGTDGDTPSVSTAIEENSTSATAADDEKKVGTSSAATPDVLDFTSETVAGEPFDGATLAGRPTVFWFWAPWCSTCRAQISGVGELAETYGDEVNVVGVGALDEQAAIEDFAAEVSPDVTLLADPEGAVWRTFGVTAQSTYLVLDADGSEKASGFLDDAELADLVQDLAG